VVLQSELSLILLTGAGLLVESLGNLKNQKYGFRTEGRVDVPVNPSFAAYTPDRLFEVYARLRQRLASISGVRGASFSLYSPMRGSAWSSGILIEGQAADSGGRSPPCKTA
jgi:macrolide transport system ATP-binding/permease protein